MVTESVEWEIVCGDVLDTLRKLKDGVFHCCVTSPPYFGLRDYGSPHRVWGGDATHIHVWGEAGRAHHPGQVEQTKWKTAEAAGKGQTAGSGRFCACGAWLGAFGLEPSPEMYVAHAVEIFRAVRRVLRDDGTLWLNIGDSYVGGGHGGAGNGRAGFDGEVDKNRQAPWKVGGRTPNGLKAKDLIGIPWMLAFALRADGWYFRGEVVWAKGNAMPESVKGTRWERCRSEIKSVEGQSRLPCLGCDKCSANGGYVLRRGSWRPTRAHEYLFQFTKTPDYYSDGEAVVEEAVGGQNAKSASFKRNNSKRGVAHVGQSTGTHREERADIAYNGETRNKRSVWNINSAPFKEAHFAVFPPALVEPCILSSTSGEGCCSECGSHYARVVERTNMIVKPSERREEAHAAGAGSGRTVLAGTMIAPATTTTGWRKTCACPSKLIIPAVVLDPFNGAGTTGLVASRLGRRYVGIDVNEDYCEMSRGRITDDEARRAL